MDLLPELEEARRNMRVKILQIKEGQEQAHKKMNKEKQKYMGLGDSCERLQQQIRSLKSTGITARIRLPRIGKRLDSTEKQLLEQEQVYNRAHGHYLEAQRQCDETIQDLYKVEPRWFTYSNWRAKVYV
jgi:chromosome segregation ATPase